MKRAFTLAEVLITLGIIGVISALILPALNNMKPDQNKVMYLKAYDTLSSIVNSLASNSGLYPVCKDAANNNNVSCKDTPLFNTNKPIIAGYDDNKYSGDKKLCSLIGRSMGIADAALNCTDTIYAYNGETFLNNFTQNISFTTQNGMRWMIRPAIATSTDVNNARASFQSDVYVDINPQNNNINGVDQSCIYNADNCNNPDIFKFIISADGKISPADPIGRQYASQRRSFVKKNDANIQDNILAMADNRSFPYTTCANIDPREVQCNTTGRIYDETTNSCVCPDPSQSWNGSSCIATTPNPPTGGSSTDLPNPPPPTKINIDITPTVTFTKVFSDKPNKYGVKEWLGWSIDYKMNAATRNNEVVKRDVIAISALYPNQNSKYIVNELRCIIPAGQSSCSVTQDTNLTLGQVYGQYIEKQIATDNNGYYFDLVLNSGIPYLVGKLAVSTYDSTEYKLTGVGSIRWSDLKFNDYNHCVRVLNKCSAPNIERALQNSKYPY